MPQFGKKILVALTGWMALLLLLNPTAYAYLDPASGSYLFQILLSFLLGFLFSLKIFWKQIAAYFSRIFSKKKPSAPK